MRRVIAVVFTADFDEVENAYPSWSDKTNIVDAVNDGSISPGCSVFLELGTGDVVTGQLMSINEEASGTQPRTPAE